MTSNAKILVCDDELHFREMVGEYLEERGYDMIGAGSAEALHLIRRDASVDLIILDINLPGTSGLDALRTLRAESDVPVIMLTAAAGVIDRVVGLEMGADDYLGKPVDLRELEARIKATLRRQSLAASTEAISDQTMPSEVNVGDCTLNLASARLSNSKGDAIAITAMEFNMLRVFVENRGRILNRDQLLEHADQRDWEPFDRSIDLRISRLRRKIERNPKTPKVIQTVRGVGYIFR